eukprot:gene8883-11982_t
MLDFGYSTTGQPSHKERWANYFLLFPPSRNGSYQTLTYENLREQTSVTSEKEKIIEKVSTSSYDSFGNGIGYQSMSYSNDQNDKKKNQTNRHKKGLIRPSPYHHYSIVDDKKKKLGLAALTVLIFYEVCGGPFGIEDIVRAGGPFYALVGFSLLLVWAIPEALITAELSTAMPEASGSVAWVDAAFGPFWAFQKGWLSWLSGVSDNALYPILFLDCFVSLINVNSLDGQPSMFSDDSVGGNGTVRWSTILIITIALTYLNYRGLDVVGSVAIGICLLSLLPFLVFCILGSFQVQPSRWLITPPGGFWGVDWRLLLNTFFWNINFWESAASFSGEVENPGKNYPRGMGIAVALVFLSLFVPILIGTGASSDSYSKWTDGYFVELAGVVVGPWLSYWLLFAAAITNIGMFEAEMSSDAWQIAGMADRGILPSFLGKRNQYDTPTYGIIISATGIICLGWMSFAEVIDVLNLLFCYGQAIEFCAFLHLRRVKPDMPRPYQVGIGFYGMCVVLSFPLAFIIVILYFSSLQSLVLSMISALSGIVVYYLLEYAKENKWCLFEDKSEVSAEIIDQTRNHSIEETVPML